MSNDWITAAEKSAREGAADLSPGVKSAAQRSGSADTLGGNTYVSHTSRASTESGSSES